MGFTADERNLHNVSLGQGQESIAEEALEFSAKNGHWLILQVSFEYHLQPVAGARAVITSALESPRCPAAPAGENNGNSGFARPLFLQITWFSDRISPKNYDGSLKLCTGILEGSRIRKKRLP
ncbi:hypothetical protein BC332_34615 [Capsicum chinense]|nr:hypothetical protein BC332_34615 [Capsicum chinense]